MARIPPPVAALLALLLLAGPAWALSFDDAAPGAGLAAFRHAATDDGSDLNYPETNGGGVCWADVDLDGVDDLFLVNGKYGNATLQARYDPRSALFLNDGDGTFTQVSRAWGADLSGWAQGCSWADFDGDGDPDLLVVGYDLIVLLRNEGDRFLDVTAAANLSLAGKCGDPRCFGETGSWADYDGDGDLDVYVTNMVDYDLDAGGLVTPALYNGQPNVLFRNRGDGTFEDATAEAGVADDPSATHSKSFQSAWADDDRDGDLDLFIASDTTVDTLFRNHGDGTFTDVADAAGVADPRSGMGVVFQDVGHDRRPDLYITHYAGEQNGFYQNRGDGTFLDRSGEGELNNTQAMAIGWGTGFHDLDHDGDLDLYQVNGHTTPALGQMNQTARVWLQRSDGTFDEVSDDAGPAFQLAMVARGSAASDYDLDGDLDLAVNAIYNQTAKLFRHGGAPGHWLQVELRQGGMNRFAVGAEVTVTPEGGAPVSRVLQAGNSFLSQDSLVVHAGLGAAGRADVQVRWPGGAVETWAGVDADQRVRLVRGSPGVLRDTLAPRTTLHLEAPGRDGWFRAPVTLTLDAVERAMGVPSGLAATEVRMGLGAWEPYAGPVVLAEEGIWTVAGRSRDLAGHQEPARTAEVRIDRTAPDAAALVEGSAGPGGWHRKYARVTVTAEDAGSGVAEVWTRLDDGPWEAREVVGVQDEGVHVVAYYAEDVAGNAGPVQSVEVRIDSLPPEAALRSPVVLALGEGRVDVDASDALSGVHNVAFFLDHEAAPRFVDLDGSDGWAWTFRADLGVHRLRAVATDRAGNTAWDEGVILGAPLPPLPLAIMLLGTAPALARRR